MMPELSVGYLVVAVLFLVGCGGERAEPESAPLTIQRWVVTSESAGPIRIGMQADAALLALGQTAAGKRDACDYLDFDGPIEVMVENDTVVRFDVVDTIATTPEGARVGDPITRIEQLYAGRIRAQPHKYTDGKYLIVPDARDTTRQLIFETDSFRITRYRAGRLPSVAYVEGCG